LSTTPVTQQLMPVVDQANGTGLACVPLSAANAMAVNRPYRARRPRQLHLRIEGEERAERRCHRHRHRQQRAGQRTRVGWRRSDGDDSCRQRVAGRWRGAETALQRRSRTSSGVIASLGVNGSQYAGADLFGRALLYTPNPVEGGSSVSHYDTLAFPNLIMEPAINGDLMHAVTLPTDLTFQLFLDIGW
jgi:hypothetical protein